MFSHRRTKHDQSARSRTAPQPARQWLLPLLALLLPLLFCMHSAFAQPWSAALTPPDGNIGGPPGSTIGWGYDIANEDAALWLVLTGVSADPFEHATPVALFDLPVLAPQQSLLRLFDGVDGLYALTWDTTAPVGYVNVGTFLLTAEWWSGDPLAGGSFFAAADSISLDYSATVTQQQPGELPVPASVALIGAGLCALALLRVQRRSPSRLSRTGARR